MEILKCEGVEKTYGSGGNQAVALAGIDLTVEKGEFVAIIGASGSGKSTLLHILGSVDKPTAGKVTVEGTDLATLHAKQAAIFRRRKVGLVYQFYNLIPTLTIRKNILMPLLLDKKKPDPAFFDQIVQSLGIQEKLDLLPNQLSGGQQQRAAIARSLIYRPAILLADEPTGNLDQKNSREIIDMLKLSNRSLKQTILLITHDLGVVAQTCEKAAIIYAGEIVEYGTVHEIFKDMRHPYTIGLMNSIPKIHMDEKRLHPIEGLMPDPMALPKGCNFCDRCRFAMEKCKTEEPSMVEVGGEHMVRCFRAMENLRGGYGDE